MDSGPVASGRQLPTEGASRNDDLCCFNRSQKFLGALARWKPTTLAIVGIMPGRVWRTNRNKLLPILLDKLSDVLAIEGRHVPCAAMRAVVVACAGPLISPYAFATGAP